MRGVFDKLAGLVIANMRAVGWTLLCCVFFALGCITVSQPLPALSKSVGFWKTMLPLQVGKALLYLPVALGLLDFTTAAFLLSTKASSRYLALVLPTQFCIICHAFFLGNCFIPSLTEAEKMTAITTLYKAAGVAGGLMLV